MAFTWNWIFCQSRLCKQSSFVFVLFFSRTKRLKSCLKNSKQDQRSTVFQQKAKFSTKIYSVSIQLGKSLDNVAHTNTANTQQSVTCSRMEQAAFWEDRSSKSHPLEPENETLIWSAGTFLDPSLAVSRLRAGVNQFGTNKEKATTDKSVFPLKKEQ